MPASFRLQPSAAGLSVPLVSCCPTAQVRGILPNVDKPPPQFDNSATVRELGVKFRDPMESFVEMGQSLIDLGLVEKK